jgi:hypothetical protein
MIQSEAQQRAQAKYYQKNKDKIYAKRRESGVYKRGYMNNYEKHREEKKEKALKHYYYIKACNEFRSIPNDLF